MHTISLTLVDLPSTVSVDVWMSSHSSPVDYICDWTIRVPHRVVLLVSLNTRDPVYASVALDDATAACLGPGVQCIHHVSRDVHPPDIRSGVILDPWI